MPELPEVETTLRGITPYLKKNRIRKILVHQAQLRWPVPDSLAQAKNLHVSHLARRGKYIIVTTNAGSIIIHLGMSGSLRIVDQPFETRKHDHVIFVLPDNKSLVYHDPRRFGSILWSDAPCDHPLLNKLGPEPLSDSFNGELLFNLSRNKNCLLYTSPSPRDATLSRMPSSA